MRTKRSFSVSTQGSSCARSASDVLGGGEHPGGAPNDDAPAVGDGVVVGLEQDLVVHDGAEQLGALGGPEQHRPLWVTKFTGKSSN
jgi:hypothetical protein